MEAYPWRCVSSAQEFDCVHGDDWSWSTDCCDDFCSAQFRASLGVPPYEARCYLDILDRSGMAVSYQSYVELGL